MDNQVFSVVVLHYKQLDYWRTAIDSILEQDYPAIQIVFADDGTPGFNDNDVKTYVAGHDRGNVIECIVLSPAANVGTTRNLNAADEACTGTYVVRFAADDALANPQTLSLYATALDGLDDGVLGVFGHVVACDEELVPSSVRQNSAARPDECAQMEAMDSLSLFKHIALSRGNRIAPGASAYKRETLNGLLPLDERFKLIEDWPFLLRATRSGWRMRYLNAPTLRYRFGGISTSMKASEIRASYLTDLVAINEIEILPFLDMFDSEEKAILIAHYLSIARSNSQTNYCELVNQALIDNRLALSVIDSLSENVRTLSEWARILEGIKDASENQAREAEMHVQELSEALVECENRLEAALSQNEQERLKNERMKQSASWRIGRTITWLPRKAKRLAFRRQ